MKNILSCLFIFFTFISSSFAQEFNMIEAGTDEFCKNTSGEFLIEKGNKGFYFDFKLIPGWYDCDSVMKDSYNMVGIRKKYDPSFIYQFYLYYNGTTKESSNLYDLVLGPGEYELVISSGRNNIVFLSYFTGTVIAELNKDIYIHNSFGKNNE